MKSVGAAIIWLLALVHHDRLEDRQSSSRPDGLGYEGHGGEDEGNDLSARESNVRMDEHQNGCRQHHCASPVEKRARSKTDGKALSVRYLTD
jgi:hypothetical protein